MNRYTTNNIECKVKMRFLGDKDVYFQIDIGDKMELVRIPRDIVKKQFTDGAFIKHVLNFFIEE